MNKAASEITSKLLEEFLPAARLLEKEGATRAEIERALENYIQAKTRRNFKEIKNPGFKRAGDAIKTLDLWQEGATRKDADSATEIILYNKLRQAGIRFVFQRQIGRYRVDFLIEGLIVEVDGPQHNQRVMHDQIRDKYLRKMGYSIMRVPAILVTATPEAVIEAIIERM